MARTYNLSTILAIAIPLGTVALIGILALTFLIIRMSVISTKERRAYLMARNSDFRRRSATGSESPRSLRRQRYRPERGCCDVLCCVPAAEDLLLPLPYSHNTARNSSRDRNHSGGEVKRLSAARDSKSSESKGNKHEPNENIKLQTSCEKLVKRTSVALEAAERRLPLNNNRSDMAKIRSPPTVTPPKPPEVPEVPEVSKVLELASPALLHDSTEQLNGSRDTDIDLDIALSPHMTRKSSESPLFVPSVWSYPVSLSLNERQSFNGSSRLSQLSRQNASGLATGQSGRPQSGESRIKANDYNINHLLELTTPSHPPPTMKSSVSGPLYCQNPSQQLLDPLNLEDTAYDLDLNTSYNMDDLIPPAKSALRNISTPSSSPISSTREARLISAGEERQASYHSVASSRSAQNIQRTGSSNSIYQTPPIAPIVPARKVSSFSSSSRRKMYLEKDSSIPPRDDEPASIDYSLVQQGTNGPLSPRNDSVADWVRINTPDLIATKNANSPGNATTVEQIAEGRTAKVSKGLSSNEKLNIDAGQQRILGFLKRDESFHRGNERAYRQHVEVGHAAVPSHSGSLVKESGMSLLDAGLLEMSLSADNIGTLQDELDPTGKPDTNGVHNSTSLMDLRSLQAGFEDSSNSRMSFAPTSLDKLFHVSDSDMRLPLIDGSDESKKSRKTKGKNGKDRISGSSLTNSTSSICLSSRGSSLTASTAWATPDRLSANCSETHVPPADITPLTPSKPVQPLVLKTSSSIRKIALLSVPRTPRSPGYSPGQMGTQALTPDLSTHRLSSYSGKVMHRLSVLGYGSAPGLVKSHRQQRRAYNHNHSGSTREKPKKKLSSSHVRVSKNTRMNRPLPTMPNGAEDGLITNLSGARYFVIQSYTRNLNDEVSLAAGEIVRVYQVFDDGWCLVRMDSDPTHKGICPHSCLKPLES